MQSLDTAYAALADPTRRAILARLALGEATVGEIAEPFPISRSRHLAPSEGAGGGRADRPHPARPAAGLPPQSRRPESAQEWLDHYRAFWTGAFDRLDAHLKQNPEKK